ncbi:trehalase-like domain-containing protein [Microbispora sp. KK1-11]|uniref:trehalase-like domain-containing protein n=1 Tax=Microbispora sp. KK1-11 TaxID=2053005 RepID=UPI0028B1592E|nr:trehalase-like domain-containing protein [Microbispora sp. KK1-11]
MRIEDYALIGDMHTAALVGRDGSVDWLCLPRFDSGACFAALLGGRSAGRWLLAPAGEGTCTGRRYRDGTLVLETTWDNPGGCVRVLDFMPPRREAPDLVRIVEGVRGRRETGCRSCSPGSSRGRAGRGGWRRARNWPPPTGCGNSGSGGAATRGGTARPWAAASSRSRPSRTPPPAASSRRPRPRCPSRSAARATGTTATAGCGTRRSPSRR